MENTMAKTDAVKNTQKASNGAEVAAGGLKIHFLADTTIPERKALGRKEGTGQWIEVAKALAQHPGKVAELLFTTDAKEANARRTALINAAESNGIEMWREKTAVRDSGKMEDGKIVFCLYAAVATDAVKAKQAKERAEKAAALEKLAKEKGFKTVEEYKASLPKRGPAKKKDEPEAPAATA